ncbi:MAG: hypothetical protein P8L78_16120 [Mariniblastus sp.]|nr:hypothetical protein [Mariniblastus sp.]
MKIRNPKNRQGITLLFVVSMIVLFLLMGTTFVVISNDYFKAARKRGQAKLHTVDHEAVIRRAFYDVVRGPSLLNQSSPLRAHDLLSDQYGYGFKAFVTDAYDLADSDLDGDVDGNDSGVDPDQFLRLILGSNTGVRNQVQDLRKSDDAYADFLNQAEPSDPNNFNVPVAGLYNGLVFSFVTKSATGYSTRVVEHSFNTDTGNHEFIIPFPRVGQFGGAGGTIADLVESQVIVNGRDFSGTGAGGAKPANATRELGDSALQPNRVGESGTNFLSEYLDGGKHSPNESYDAADFQNMFLSGRDRDGEVIPSFHRESLSAPGGPVVVPGIGQGSNKFIPNTDDLTANSEYLYGGNLLDVDSDNDGEKDAVFIDNGYELITDADGRRFKPRVAYKVVDLDGRLNLNAHGSLVQAKDDYFISQQIHNSNLPRGQGYGPPEISFAEIVFNDDPNRDASLPSLDANLKLEKYQYLMEGRYGQSGTPGYYNDPEPDTLRKLFGYPRGVVNWPVAVGTVNRDSADNGSLFASSAMDIHGRFSFGFPQTAVVINGNPIDDFRDPNVADFPSGLPVIDMVASEFGNDFEFANNPYEMTFDYQSGSSHSNTPFSPADLERHLRPFDVDTNVLPRTIPFDSETDSETDANNGIVGGIPRSKRNLITTESWDVPMIPDNFKAKLISRLPTLAADLGPTATLPAVNARADQLINAGLFAPELLAGLKMNVNRPLGNGWDDNGNGVVDEPGEANLESNRDFTKFKNPGFDLDRDFNANSGWNSESKARVLFARHLYMLAMLLSDEVNVDLDGDTNTSEYAQVIAQWAVNVVDFRDPDSIMTRFQFDPNPWDGTWDTNNANTVWGCERPELLITETFAFHDRRVEDVGAGGGTVEPDNDDNDYDNRLRPEAGAFIELYNPWTQNSLNQRQDPSLYVSSNDNSNQGVDLARKSNATGGNDNRTPVWRLSVDRPERDANADPENTIPRRFVYFTDPTDGGNDPVDDDNGNDVEVFYTDFDATVVRPGSQTVIGSLGHDIGGGEYVVPMGRLSNKTATDEQPDNLDLANTHALILDPDNGIIKTFPEDNDVPNGERQTRILPINLPRSFNVSDKFGGYNTGAGIAVETQIADGVVYTPPFDTPLDANTDANRDDDDLRYIWTDDGSTSQQFRIVKLQRLANPLIPFDSQSNPYITVDQLDMDLTGFNGLESNNNINDDVGLNLTGNLPVASQEGNISLERGQSDQKRLLFQSSRSGIAAGQPEAAPVVHNFAQYMVESLGKTNNAYVNAAQSQAFAWLTWNNRPFVSHLELANVPFAESDWLTRNFTEKQDNYDPYSGDDDIIRGRFHHLLNFFANDSDAGGGDRANLHRIMDYIEVPSRFVGTKDYLNTDNYPQPFNFLSRYRVPGKVNLNTIYSDSPLTSNQSTIWNGLQGGFASLGGGVNYQNFADSRENGNPSAMPTDFGNPFRPSDENVNVPQNVPLVTEVGSTLLRNSASTSIGPAPETKPLFDFDNTAPIYNADRNAYFRNLQRQRLGNLVTSKSSVFAVWVTVGYFEVDENGLVGAEIGADTGDVQRNRGFFMFDRSIPMAFEPGKNHNIEKGILVETIIE